MTTAFRELIESRSTTDQIGRKGTRRVFHDEISPELAKLEPQCPKVGDKLPWDNEQKCVDVSADWVRGSGNNGVKTSEIVVTYDTSGATWGGVNPNDPFFKSWTLSYFRVNQDIPYAFRDTRTHRYNDQAGVNHFITSFPVQTTAIFETRKKFVRRVRITNMAAAQWEPIGAQTNKLHKIYTFWYLFSVGDIQEVSSGVWDVNYTWEYDPGTPNAFQNLDPDISFPFSNQCRPTGMYPGALYCRPPFHKILTVPQVGPSGGDPNAPTWPKFVPICDYETNASGYNTLPGFTL